MPSDIRPRVSHEGDILRINGHPTRMAYMVRDAFWAADRVIVLLDPDAYLDDPAFGAQRRKPRDPVKNLQAYSPDGEQLWQAEQPEFSDHYYKIETREPLVALSFSAYRCDIDLETGRILKKHYLK
ncbi:MAG: hypothetical protein HC814_00750 [Rhodobacteraceae bacterium]|nr:hypothetical protein [Paracoccaceae bacterium]